MRLFLPGRNRPVTDNPAYRESGGWSPTIPVGASSAFKFVVPSAGGWLYGHQSRPRIGGLAWVRVRAVGLAAPAIRRRRWMDGGFAETISTTELRSVSRSVVHACD